MVVVCVVVVCLMGKFCKMCYDCDDDMVIIGKCYDFCIDYIVGFDDDGCIVGIEFI